MAVERGTGLWRDATMQVLVEDVVQGDILFGHTVRYSEPYSDYIWQITAEREDGQAGTQLQMTTGETVTVVRRVPLEPDQCISCGRHGVKYAAKHQCSRCYQRQHRATARKQPSKVKDEETLPYPA